MSQTVQKLTLAENLQYLIEEHQISESELGRRCNIAQPILNRIKRGKEVNPKLETLLKIANYFKLSVAQLIGQESFNIQNPPSHSIAHSGWRNIPFMCWDNLSTEEVLNAADTGNYPIVHTELDITTPTFALKMQDDSMEPMFLKNTVLIFSINAEKEHKSGDFVLVKLNKNNSFVFRKLLIENGNKYIAQLNTDPQDIIELTKDDQIFADLVQARYDF